ncbi:MAG: MFS transporter [Verrucomicrobia bacterium]|nr:MAG: MFS transporter [Verrucomicrobiota bacterium]
MTHRQLKTGYFILAALNTLASSYYLNYLFFFLRDQFGFGNKENLWVSALHGFIYTCAAWQCGKFAERRGFVFSLKVGFLSLAGVMIGGALLPGVMAQLAMVAAYSVTLLLTWPALEALVSERESQAGVQEMVGIYNCTWAGSAAFAYFTGGKLYDALGKGAIFWLPAGIFIVEFFFVRWLEKQTPLTRPADTLSPSDGERAGVRGASHHPEPAAFQQPVSPKAFLKMAWLANPFAYIAINTLLAVMPGVAQKLGLSPTKVGLFCSVWFFGRFAAFALLWKWRGWHYRFRWMLGAFLLLIGSFAAVLLAHELWIVVLAQVFLGLAVGLLYYSSLFYSMDVGETKGEHGGLHEAFIGVGIFLGPATGATALQFAAHNPNAGTWAVSTLLTAGVGGLLWLRARGKRTKHCATE